MDIKCPKCGNNLGEFDVFCAQCGAKIDREEIEKAKMKEELENQKLSNEEENNSKEEPTSEEILKKSLNNFLNRPLNREQRSEFFDPSAKNKLYNNPLVTFGTFILIVVVIFSLCVGLVIQRQNSISLGLKYKNYLNNPLLIPEFKEVNSYHELKNNFSNVNDFLELYLKFSNDSNETKEQIFMSYLKEAQKVSHITSENVSDDEIKECSSIKTNLEAQKCSKALNKKLKSVGVSSYSNRSVVYLYPNCKYLYKRYSKYFSKDIKEYLKLLAKYNIPSTNGLELAIKPKTLAKKIADFEEFMLKTQNLEIKGNISQTLFKDTRSFIFAPEIYATTTHEIRKDFKSAYLYFINSKRNSGLRPLFMSYLDKQSAYAEENFNIDYPYEKFDNDVKAAIENSTFQDIFSSLKNKSKSSENSLNFKYIYSSSTMTFRNFDPQEQLSEGDFIISDIDENNNIIVYSNSLSLFQEINLSKSSILFLSNSKLYAYNKDKLSITSFNFNGRTFSTTILPPEAVSSIFAGINIINIDSYDSYNIYLEKPNKQASYIILSKHSQGWGQYTISTLQGEIQELYLSSMFKVNSLEDVVLSFHGKNVNPNETSDSAPTYRITIHTLGHAQSEPLNNQIINYDEATKEQAQEDATVGNSQNKNDLLPKIDIEQEKDNSQIAPPPTEPLGPPVD